jgi:hypothetical protein
MVRLEGLGELKQFSDIESRTHDLPAYIIAPQITLNKN